MNAIRNRRKAIEAEAKVETVPVTYDRVISKADLDAALHRHEHLWRGGRKARSYLLEQHEALMNSLPQDSLKRRRLDEAGERTLAHLRRIESILRYFAIAFSDEAPHE